MSCDRHTDPAGWINSIIINFMDSSPHNTLELAGGEKAFDRPLVGFSTGADPLYEEYRRHIGDFYFTPLAFFRAAMPDQEARAEELTVISWILPSTKATRADQAKQRKHPAERWARTRHQGELCNNALRAHVAEKLNASGIPAFAPLLASGWSRSDQGPYAPCSNWSERHAAHAAGLGTFGLCDGLITPVGKAVRIGSVIAKIGLPPTPRPYTDHHGYCLHFTADSCRKCIPRCPVNALSENGHDKNRCMRYTERSMNAYIKKAYGIDTYACGLCQCGVPCMDHIPDRKEG